MPADAIMVLPGFPGTTLWDYNQSPADNVWDGKNFYFGSVGDIELQRDPDGKYYDQNPRVQVSPGGLQKEAYGAFADFFRARKANIHLLNYDWRYPAAVSARQLRQYMELLIKRTALAGGEIRNFDLVTHSGGNLVARAYLKAYGMSLINRIVFVAPPFKGSLGMVEAVIKGRGLFEGLRQDNKRVVRTFPGAMELLPQYPLAGVFHSGAEVGFFEPEHWQAPVDELEEKYWPVFTANLANAKEALGKDILDLAQLTGEDLSRMLVFIGERFNTYQSLRVDENGDPANFFELDDARRDQNGDGTVPHASQAYYSQIIDTVVLRKELVHTEPSQPGWQSPEFEHALIMSHEPVQELIWGYLQQDNGQLPAVEYYEVKKVVLAGPQTADNGLTTWPIKDA